MSILLNATIFLGKQIFLPIHFKVTNKDFHLIQIKEIRKRKIPKEKSSNNQRLSELFLLDYQDSNLDKQNQKLLCYHYTIVQTIVLSVKKRCKDRGLQAKFQIFWLFFFDSYLQIVLYYLAISK